MASGNIFLPISIGASEGIIPEGRITRYYSILNSSGELIGTFPPPISLPPNQFVNFSLKELTESTFIIRGGFNNAVDSIAVLPDGKKILGGGFTSYLGVAKSLIVKLNSDGSIDNTFNQLASFNQRVLSIQVQPDNKLLMCGQFTIFNGVTRNRIIRLNEDGSIDNTFNIGTGFNNIVQTIKLQPDGKILCGGNFTTFNGVTRNRIARLNSDGTLDTSFDPGVGFSNLVRAIELQSDEKIVVGGNFTSFSGSTRNRIVRLNEDGTHDNTFNVGTGLNDLSNSIVIQSDGKIVIAGYFTIYNSIASNSVVRVNTDGSIDSSFALNLVPGFNLLCNSIALQSDGKILCGGSFTTFNGVTRNRIARLNSDGTLDTSFDPGVGFNNTVSIVKIDSNENIHIGGFFNS